ncbi:MAG: transcription elongation factor GreA [Candidatus Howiella sp.]|jgi:transcription elongation factor GreA
MAKQIVLTEAGLKKIEDELEELRTHKRKEIAEKIKIARSFGDLSENSEYDEAKNEQAKVEARIADLEAMLKNAKMVDESISDGNTVEIGSTVRVLDVEFKEEVVYQVVGSAESDPVNGKISDESPVGQALLGSRKGAKVVAETPQGELKFKVLEIMR